MPKAPNLLRKVSIEGQWKMLPVARNKISGGEQRYDMTRVMLAGAPVTVIAGTFYLEYRENGRRVRRAIGDHPAEAKVALATQASVIGLRSQGVTVADAPQLRPRSTEVPAGKTIRTVVDAFVKSPPLEYRRKTYVKYRNALETFATWSRKRYCVEIDRDDIKAFLSDLVHQFGLDISTAVDKAVIVCKILRDQGAPIDMRRGDWPKVTERQPEIYRPETLKALFAAAEREEFILFQTFLLSGMREAEVSHLHWTDFDPVRSTLRVSKKIGFDPKNYQERTVPVPRVLVDLLKEQHRLQETKQLLIFPTSTHNTQKGAPGGQADGHMLRRLKRMAWKAGLNCGRCKGTLNRKPVSCKTEPICTEFGLHKFRHTYATTLLRDGVDLLSLQKLLGHKDLDSTRKYLRALEPDDLLMKINGTSLATRFV
jgi:integrase/recombinase XerD